MNIVILCLVAIATFVAGRENVGGRDLQRARYYQVSILDKVEELDVFVNDIAHVEKERMMDHVVKSFKPVGQPSADLPHELTFVTSRRNVETMKTILSTISDPSHEDYGKFLTKESLNSLIRNNNATRHVETYLRQNGVENIQVNLEADYITATAPIHLWEQLLQCTFYLFKDDVNEIVRSRGYSLAESIANDVHTVFGATHLPDPHARPLGLTKVSSRSLLSTGEELMDPLQLFSFYGIGEADRAFQNSSQGLLTTLGQSYSLDDLDAFQKLYSLSSSISINMVGSSADHAVCEKNADDCREGNLDLSYLLSIAPNVPTTDFTWNGNDFIVGWMLEVVAMEDVPRVLSISYGTDEAFVPPSYASIFDILAMELSLRGVTIVAASGDDGAIGTSARTNSFYCGYRATFPASSPYVIAVGATMGPESGRAEVACQSDRGGDATSGGGFSSLFAAPEFQSSHIASFFTKTQEDPRTIPLPGFASNGRGIPDVALLGHNFQVMSGGQTLSVSGTSASTPVFGAMISLVNSARIAQGKDTLGWLNPALYAKASLFARDITSGHNKCAARAMTCCNHGFHAMEGWDPVTGLGGVDFAKFKAALLELGGEKAVYSATPPTELTAPPTHAPTAAPVAPKGWLSMREYNGEFCKGTVTQVTSIVTGSCMPYYTIHNEVAGSMDFTCEGDRVIVRRYSDQDCSSSSLTSQSTGSLGCAFVAMNYYDSPDTFSTDLICSSASQAPRPPVLSEYYDKDYLVHWGYHGDGCEHGVVNTADAVRLGTCFNNYRYDVSFKYTVDEMITYQSTNCSTQGDEVKAVLPAHCAAADSFVSDLYFYNYYYGGNAGDGVAVTGKYEQWVLGDPANMPSDTGNDDDFEPRGTSPTIVFVVTFIVTMTVVFLIFVFLFRPEWLRCTLYQEHNVQRVPVSTVDDDDEEEGVAMNTMHSRSRW